MTFSWCGNGYAETEVTPDITLHCHITGAGVSSDHGSVRITAALLRSGSAARVWPSASRKGEMVSGRQNPDMKIFSRKQDVTQEDGNPFRVVWQAVAQGITSIFTNHAQADRADCGVGVMQ